MLALATASAAVIVAAVPGIASASVAPHRPPRPGARAVPGSGLTLAQAPAGLRAAVRKTLRRPAAPGDGALQKAELTAPGGLAGGGFGTSVAIAGSTAVVGAPGANSSTGAAYVFVRSGSTWSERTTLTAPGGAAGDHFGEAVAIAGSTAVVGAYGVNGNTGAAYVFTGSGGIWSEQAKLTAADGASEDEFGYSVAISGSTVVIGGPFTNSYTGAAYVFTGSGGTWSQQAELTDPEGGSWDAFGSSVALSGSTAVVGAEGANGNTGVAYVFTGSHGIWSQQAELVYPGGIYGDNFGLSVALAGSTLVVGEPDEDGYGGPGAVYVFVRSGSTWTQQAKVTDPASSASDYFGTSVVLSGSTLVVGAPGTFGNTGAVWQFVRSGSTWTQKTKLTASNSAVNDEFGNSVALSGSTAVAGAPGANSSTGAAYVFALPSQQAKLTAPDHAKVDEFGRSVAISGSTAVVGAPGANSSTGTAYVFTRSGRTWTLQAELTGPGTTSGDEFGYSVALSGPTAMVAAPGTNSASGVVYVFTRSGRTWTQQATLTDPGGHPDDTFGYSMALSGSTAVVAADGTNSFTGQAYVFTQSGSTWNQQATLADPSGTAEDQFGSSVALSGSTAVVGADGTNSSAGAAYVFTQSGSTWPLQATLTDPGGASGDEFGYSVALSGSTAVVAAPGTNSYTGTVYKFTGSGGTWSQQAELTDPGGTAYDFFGASVALSGPTAVLVGADGTNSGTGTVYLFISSGSTWPQQATLTAPDHAANGEFGASVSLSGSTAVIGAPTKNSSTGAAYVFTT